jgi:hypothetical protein
MSISKTDIRYASAPDSWCVRTGGTSQMVLTHTIALKRGTISDEKQQGIKSNTFKQHNGYIGGEKRGIILVIDGYAIDPKTGIIYVKCDDEKFYRLLMNTKSLKTDTFEGVVSRLRLGGVAMMSIG